MQSVTALESLLGRYSYRQMKMGRNEEMVAQCSVRGKVISTSRQENLVKITRVVTQ